MMKYGVVLFPSKKLQDTANSYRKRYDSRYALIPPHITVKEQFETSTDELETLIPTFHDIAHKLKPITINVTKISSFSPANNTVYLKVEKNDDLKTLYEQLHSGPLAQEVEYSYIPHITIGQNLSDDEHLDVYSQLKLVNINHEEVIDRFHLLYQLDNGSWTVYETFRFGHE
ncbi:hypothetical protein FH5_02746 [Priestia endophytica]|jgi:2'-5' RNA ligase|nr:hypothetical protein FH5_02746 [Priestia endophytica]